MYGVPPHHEPKAPHPARGVHIHLGQPTIVFLNLTTEGRTKLLANDQVHDHLRQAWTESTAWMVGYYVIMPDHLHLFAAPVDITFKFDNWVTYWQRQFRRIHRTGRIRWQSKPFHHRLRKQESYIEKLSYSRQNPVEAGLVTNPEDWPYQGTLNTLTWH